jgi:hypothetical protein
VTLVIPETNAAAFPAQPHPQAVFRSAQGEAPGTGTRDPREEPCGEGMRT